jgi:hypothetical protein
MVRPQLCLRSVAASILLLARSAQAAAASTAPVLDVTNAKQLTSATVLAMGNLLGYFPSSDVRRACWLTLPPNAVADAVSCAQTGTFDQAQVVSATLCATS